MSAWGLFIVWLMASASATTPLLGNLLRPYGLLLAVGAVAAAWAIGAVPAGLFSEMGRERPVTALVAARATFGRPGSFAFAALFSVVNLAWFGLNTAVGASILAGITHSSPLVWDLAVGAAQVVLVLFGMKWLERFYRYTTVALIVCYLALAGYLAGHYALPLPPQTKPMAWGTALTTVLTFSVLAWAYKLSTTSRFAVPVERTGGYRARFFLLPSIGIMLAVLLMGVLGMYSQEATGNWNIALLGAHIAGWGWVAAIGAALAVIHTNAMNLYPSTVDLLVAVDDVVPTRWWAQPAATLLLGAGGMALAIAGILAHAGTLLVDAGNVIIPFTFVMLLDWLAVQRRRTPVERFFARPATPRPALAWAAVAAVAVGSAIGYLGADFLPVFCYRDLPLPVVGGGVAALLYGAVVCAAGAIATFVHPLSRRSKVW